MFYANRIGGLGTTRISRLSSTHGETFDLINEDANKITGLKGEGTDDIEESLD